MLPWRTPGAVPEADVAALLFREAPYDIAVQIGADRAGEPERLVIGEFRRLEGIPGQHKESGGGIEIGIGREMRQLIQGATV